MPPDIDHLTDEEADLLNITREDPEQKAREEKERAEKTEIRREFLRNLMTSASFREWLWEFLIEQGTFAHTFGVSPTGFPDPMATMLNLGLKQAGMNLLHQFDDVAPDLVSLMRREAGQRL